MQLQVTFLFSALPRVGGGGGGEEEGWWRMFTLLLRFNKSRNIAIAT